MTIIDPTADDLRQIAMHMKSEFPVRAETILNAADQLEAMLAKVEKYTKYGQAVFSLWEIRNNMADTYTVLSKSIVKRAMDKHPAKDELPAEIDAVTK